MNEKIKKSIENYEAAFKKLDEYVLEPVVNDRDRAGIIKAFEFTFELVWKAFQKIAQDEGLEAGGPKSSLKQAFKLNIISNEDEEMWLQMLDDRNLMSHTYRDKLSAMICERVQKTYHPALGKILSELKKDRT